MKYTYLILLSIVLSTACSKEKKENTLEAVLATNNLTAIRKKKSELETKKADLNSKIKTLEAKIKDLDPQEKIPLITTFTTKESVFNHFIELQGNVSTKQNVIIFPEFAGLLNQVYIKEGQRVSKGQRLATIDDAGLSQQLAQLKIQAQLAKTTFERQNHLWKQSIGSEIQYLQAKANFETQEQAVKQLEKQLEKTIIRAPFTGTIDDIITERGNVVAPGQTPLFRIVNLKNMHIETDVPEQYLAQVTQGKNVLIDFNFLNEPINSKIRQAGNFINPANRTFKIEVGIPVKNEQIKPNLSAKLKINDYTNAKAILIPQSIISENANGQQYVYAVENKNNNQGKVKRLIIETGKTQADNIEILSGLTKGIEIINEGARSVKEGQEVKILTL